MDIQDFIKIDNQFKEGDNSAFGRELMTNRNLTSSNRGNMWATNMKQIELLLNPTRPRVNTSFEYTFGYYSTANKRANSRYKIVDKILKFNDDRYYLLVVHDIINDKYDIIEKSNYEKLQESYGYKYNTKNIDSKKVGDIIEKDELMYTSTSFDEDGYYRFGVDALAMFTVNHLTLEDGLKVSKSLAKKLSSTRIDVVEFGLNDNETLLNLYGDDDNYKPFPEIGEYMNNDILVSKRLKRRDSMFVDFSNSALRKINFTNDTVISSPKGKIIDMYVYGNKNINEMPITYDYDMIKKYYSCDLSFSEKIVNILGGIYKDNKNKCTPDFTRWLNRHKGIIEEIPIISNKKTFSNIKMVFFIEVENRVDDPGFKIVGRYGDKGVICKVEDDELMPKLSDGRTVDILCNVNGIGNRHNAFQVNEITINFMSNRILEYANNKIDSYREKLAFVMDYINSLNMEENKENYDVFLKIKDSEEWCKRYFESINEHGIEITSKPFWNFIDIYKIKKTYEKYANVMPRYTATIKKWGHDVEMLDEVVAGEKYIIKLKHTPGSKFMARSTGKINNTGLPCKDESNKFNESAHSKNAVRQGEQETLSFQMMNQVDLMIQYGLAVRSSIENRKDLTEQLYTKDIFVGGESLDFREGRNRAAEKLHACLSGIGVGLNLEKDKKKRFIAKEYVINADVISDMCKFLASEEV